MKKSYLLSALLCFAVLFPCFGGEYTIKFAGETDSGPANVESVVVTNLTLGISVTVPAGNDLLLSSNVSGIETVNADNEGISVSSRNGISTLSFIAKQSGNASIDVFSFDGKKIVGTTQHVAAGKNSFEFSVPQGAYVVSVSGKAYAYHAKFIEQASIANAGDAPQLKPESGAFKAPQLRAASAGVTSLKYEDGNNVMYTGYSGNMTTIITDSPVSNSTMFFYFVDCTDGSGNHYKVVQIGMQVWMAEDLKTTKLNDGTNITLGTSETWTGLTTPAYYVSEAQHTYYNWYAASNSKLAPAGEWRVASKEDWYQLATYLENWTSGKRETPASAAAATYDWTYKAGSALYTAGDVMSKNNTTGFTAYPAGYYTGTVVDGKGDKAVHWTSTETNGNEDPLKATDATIFNDYPIIHIDYGWRNEGMSVRCVMDY